MNKLRSKLQRVFNTVAKAVSKTGITPNQLTILSLIVAILGYSLVLIYKSILIPLVVILVSGFIDAIDGALARLEGKTTRRGAFLDSTIDRLCEVLYVLSLIPLGFNSELALVYLSLSLIVSYMRARGESLGVSLSGVGLMERAERIIGLVVILVVSIISLEAAQWGLIALTILVAFTVIERFIYVWKNLS